MVLKYIAEKDEYENVEGKPFMVLSTDENNTVYEAWYFETETEAKHFKLMKERQI